MQYGEYSGVNPDLTSQRDAYRHCLRNTQELLRRVAGQRDDALRKLGEARAELAKCQAWQATR
jgi:hypothetical protein